MGDFIIRRAYQAVSGGVVKQIQRRQDKGLGVKFFHFAVFVRLRFGRLGRMLRGNFFAAGQGDLFSHRAADFGLGAVNFGRVVDFFGHGAERFFFGFFFQFGAPFGHFLF